MVLFVFGTTVQAVRAVRLRASPRHGYCSKWGDCRTPCPRNHTHPTPTEEMKMKWTTPECSDLRFGFEITLYIANR